MLKNCLVKACYLIGVIVNTVSKFLVTVKQIENLKTVDK